MYDQIKWVCAGTCAAVVSNEEYEAGLEACGTKGCSRFGHHFEKRYECDECKALYRKGENHVHEEIAR